MKSGSCKNTPQEAATAPMGGLCLSPLPIEQEQACQQPKECL